MDAQHASPWNSLVLFAPSDDSSNSLPSICLTFDASEKWEDRRVHIDFYLDAEDEISDLLDLYSGYYPVEKGSEFKEAPEPYSGFTSFLDLDSDDCPGGMDEDQQVVQEVFGGIESGVSLEDSWHAWSAEASPADREACEALDLSIEDDVALKRLLERTCAFCLVEDEKVAAQGTHVSPNWSAAEMLGRDYGRHLRHRDVDARQWEATAATSPKSSGIYSSS
ncbi:hypothetical protein BKA70DRAFT_1423930 [Coprinopsis sp. MPI-PUGE-AT-0042]|nr:hypothetical protein BKA70DRAFT_1423930 [Coprinopsis sp. MPI-PUGE-AT-0042]